MENHGGAEGGVRRSHAVPLCACAPPASAGLCLPYFCACHPGVHSFRLTPECLCRPRVLDLKEGVPSSRRPAGPSRAAAMTMILVAALLCAKLAGPPRPLAALAPEARELAVRELLTAKENAVAVKTAKMSAAHAAAQAVLAGEHSALIKSVQKLDEQDPAEGAAEGGAPPAPPPASDADKGAEEGQFINSRQNIVVPGWDKSGWSTGDWASWVITGPLITVAFSFFMFYTYGVPAGALTSIICACIDVATFYYNW